MRIKEALGLKRTSKTTEFNCPLTTSTAHQTMSLRKGVLKRPRDSSYTTSLQPVPMLHHPEKKFCPVSNLNLPWHTLRPFPPVPSVIVDYHSFLLR